MLPTKNVTSRRSTFQTNAQQVSARCTVPTRRGVLRGASVAALAAIVSQVRAAQPVGPVMAQLSAYMAAARERELPATVVEKAKHHILDTVAAMISGSPLAPGEAAIRFARAYGGERIATVVASDVLCGPIEAAMANGMLAHADETDDSHAPSLSHPGCAVVPAALASASSSASTASPSCAPSCSAMTSGRGSR
jgi:hypothetical protein